MMMWALRRPVVRFPRNVICRPLSDVVKWKSVALIDRALIRVSGEESAVFLQGLVTNDLNSLVDKESSSIYCMFLNTGGRVLFDAIISPGFEPNQYLVEVDQKLSKAVVKHLSMYKVRRKIQIEAMKNLTVSSIFHENLEANVDSSLQTRSPLVGSTLCDGGARGSLLPPVSDSTSLCFPDPRVDLLGYRYIGPEGQALEKNSSIKTEEGTSIDYVIQRCWAGVAEGSKEIVPAKALPIECNVDYLHGVSFHKGCYIGQELTARTHHTGVIRKRILPLKFQSDAPVIDFDADIVNENGKSVGKMRQSAGKYGLALVRLKEAFAAESLQCNGATLIVWKPAWWPQDKVDDVKKDLN